MCKYNIMKYTHITIAGSNPVEYDYKASAKLGDIVSAGILNKTVDVRYAVTTNELELQQMINYPKYTNTALVTSEDLFKKYMFFDNVEYAPHFGDIPKLNVKLNECSNQLLALLVACWTEVDRVFICGYDIEHLTERALLIKTMQINPTIKFYYCRKPNVNKIKLFDHLDNVQIFNFPEFKNYGKETD